MALPNYDIVWLISALGAAEAASMVAESPLLTGPHRDAVVAELDRLVADQFVDTASVGPMQYVKFLNAAPGDKEKRHAMETLKAFGTALKTAGVTPASPPK